MRSTGTTDLAIRIQVVLPSAGSRNHTRSNQHSRWTVEADFNVAARTGAGHTSNKSIHTGQIDVVVSRPITRFNAMNVLSAFGTRFNQHSRRGVVICRRSRENDGIAGGAVGEYHAASAETDR